MKDEKTLDNIDLDLGLATEDIMKDEKMTVNWIFFSIQRNVILDEEFV